MSKRTHASKARRARIKELNSKVESLVQQLSVMAIELNEARDERYLLSVEESDSQLETLPHEEDGYSSDERRAKEEEAFRKPYTGK